ncbi:MAG: cupin domain-containing protein [Rikenellaceae bacterium]
MKKDNIDNELKVETLLDRVSTSWDGVELENYPSGKPTFTMQKITIPPKTKMASHSHTIMQLGYILSGELTITTDDGKTVTFKAGDPAVETVGKVHYGENKGDVDTVVVVVSLIT